MKGFNWNDSHTQLDVILDDDESKTLGLTLDNFTHNRVDFNVVFSYIRENVDVPDSFFSEGLLVEVSTSDDNETMVSLVKAENSSLPINSMGMVPIDSVMPAVLDNFDDWDSFVAFMDDDEVPDEDKAALMADILCASLPEINGESSDSNDKSIHSGLRTYFCKSFSSLNDVIYNAKLVPEEKSFVAKEKGIYYFVIKVDPHKEAALPFLCMGGTDVYFPVTRESYYKEHNLMIIKENAIAVCRKL